MDWKAIGPLLGCDGDAMVTWFEDGAWRLKRGADTESSGSEGQAKKLDDVFGSNVWQEAQNKEEMTRIYIDNVIEKTIKSAAARVSIKDRSNNHYDLILFAGKFDIAEKLVKRWEKQMVRRLNSPKGMDIRYLLEVGTGRTKTLFDFQSQ